jgi:hypothetical protein
MFRANLISSYSNQVNLELIESGAKLGTQALRRGIQMLLIRYPFVYAP